MSRLELLPAVDVTAGRAGQVVSGSADPGDVARAWVGQGAGWVHLVDLDRARGTGHNGPLLADLVAELTGSVRVQLSGGIGDEASLCWALGTGADRVNLSSTALRDPGFVRGCVEAHGASLLVGLDVAGDEVVARGSGVRIGRLDDVLPLVAGWDLLLADAGRDGTRHGVDLVLVRRVAERVERPLVASGGIASVGDLAALARLRVGARQVVRGVVLGSALYHGAFTLAEAVAAVAAVEAGEPGGVLDHAGDPDGGHEQ